MKSTASARIDRQFLRFLINGAVATLVHYACLMLLLEGVEVSSAGAANLVAACFGVSCSFVGNRLFVFPGSREAWPSQFARFALLYGVLALAHGVILYVWTDRLHLAPSVGFAIAVVVQTAASFIGGRKLVFRDPRVSETPQ